MFIKYVRFIRISQLLVFLNHAASSYSHPHPNPIPPGIEPFDINPQGLPAFIDAITPISQDSSDDRAQSRKDQVPNTASIQPKIRAEASAYDVCTSPDFQLTVANFQESGTAEFLKNFTIAAKDEPVFRRYGLLAAVGYTFLGRPEYKCAMGYSSSCTATCQEVVQNVKDLDLARKVYFALVSGKHYLQHMESIDRAIDKAGFTVSQWVVQMSFTFFWWTPQSAEVAAHALSDIGFAAVMWGYNSMVPVQLTVPLVLEAIGGTMRAAYDFIQNEFVQGGYAHWRKLTGAVNAIKVAEITRHSASHAIQSTFIMPNGQSLQPIHKFKAYDGNRQTGTALNSAQMSMWLAEVIRVVRQHNHANVDQVLRGPPFAPDGTTSLSAIIGTAAFIQPYDEKHLRHSSWIENAVTRALQYQMFSLALISQHSYITCTKTFKDSDGYSVPTCNLDKSGPQNLKACLGDQVCYLYRWNFKERGFAQHADEPHGIDYLEHPPFHIPVSDIIESSVLTHLEKAHPDALMKLWQGSSLERIYDADAPGSFAIPVCFRDPDNWNTPLKPYSLFGDDLNPWSSKKTFPCACGHWGNETNAFWDATGLTSEPIVRKYIDETCPASIQKRTSDALEKFLIFCNIGFKESTSWLRFLPFRSKYEKKSNRFCAYVTDLIQKTGSSPQNLEPGLRIALECKLGLVSDSDGRAMCNTFEKKVDYRMWFDKLKDWTVNF